MINTRKHNNGHKMCKVASLGKLSLGKLCLNISNKRNISSDYLGKEQGPETSNPEVLMWKPTCYIYYSGRRGRKSVWLVQSDDDAEC